MWACLLGAAGAGGRAAASRIGLCACLGPEDQCHTSRAKAEAPVAMAIANRGSCDLNRE